MTYEIAFAAAKAEKFQYELNGYATAIVHVEDVVVLVDDGTGQTLARFPFQRRRG